MRKLETWLTGLLGAAAVLLLPMMALEPCPRSEAPALGAGACDDGSAHLAMGCASVLL